MAEGRSEELRRRRQRYLVSMLIRTVCFVLAVVTTGPARWLFILGALVLPYVAVVFANTARRKPENDSDVLHPEPIGALPPPPPGESSPPSARDDD
ncbi:Protein of unknown function (DUF3099) [Mumia flava]|uniref:DUF3099 family protein n=1 Tax=Mumia flava TaxID=1348852 RepID=A0A2M9B6K0_9ACTN|nr:Protein of unknown function (DUF3099) [Mumia flava]